MQAFNEALSIMVVGMITVFSILFLIVFVGNLIIRLSNKYIPEAVVEVKTKKTNTNLENTHAAISAAISIATQGKGKVTSITKI